MANVKHSENMIILPNIDCCVGEPRLVHEVLGTGQDQETDSMLRRNPRATLSLFMTVW